MVEPSPSRDAAHRMSACWTSWTQTPASLLRSRLRSASPAASLTAASRPSSRFARASAPRLSTAHFEAVLPYQAFSHGLESVPLISVVTESSSSFVGG